MLRSVLLWCLLCIVVGKAKYLSNDEVEPSSKVLWPYPNEVVFGNTELIVYPNTFEVHIKGSNQILEKAIERYLPLIFPYPFEYPHTQSELGYGIDYTIHFLSTLSIIIPPEINTTLSHREQEKYQLQIVEASRTPEDGLLPNEYEAFLFADDVIGAIRGLHTFSQLIQAIPGEKLSHPWTYHISDVPLSIHDIPKFHWKGLMIDTARHYSSISELESILDAMEWSKLNMFHWHITDNESFPFTSKNRPKLNNGAFSDNAIYSYEDIQHIIDYGMDRGIEVIPEIDIPSHVASWSKGITDITIKCEEGEQINIGNEVAYDVINDLYKEMDNLFPARYVHYGGNDVNLDCWDTMDETQFWTEHNLENSSTKQKSDFFFEQTFQMLFHNKKKILIWEDLLPLTSIPPNTIVQAWKNGKGQGYAESISKGYKTILSTNYIIDDIQSFQENWKELYKENEAELTLADAFSDLAIGGEALLWSKFVGDKHRETALWPYAAIIAERLWSDSSNLNDDTESRLKYWICRLNRRGIDSAEISPGYCPILDTDFVYSFKKAYDGNIVHFVHVKPINDSNKHYEEVSVELNFGREESESSEDESINSFTYVIIASISGVFIGLFLKLLWHKIDSKPKLISVTIVLGFFIGSIIYRLMMPTEFENN